ncbi:hypothetical protein PAAG_06199 [Paracoccidioides lutzii Pb01]|uniref:Uncharacterized protein n=1 Tax=Paracoccidioides lutzii (strain ATCC MYA-826 / Pb01) TaxID=502779 RepID=C1H689_PARBA|nr:hypothetical protein PAAG_06199 [Paracoccidioides lutzii Pb01]EEH35152.2 hypothetical protein PAAG_06199 [Paracoccidioides lutzii Pb01]
MVLEPGRGSPNTVMAVILKSELSPKDSTALGDSGSEHVTGLTPTSAEPSQASQLSGTSTAHILQKNTGTGRLPTTDDAS